MAAGLFTTDPIVAQNFFLEIDGEIITALISVSGLDVEVSVTTITQNGAGGQRQLIKSRGNDVTVGDLSLTRMAPLDATADPMWKWFNDVRGKGIVAKDRTSNRKNGAIVLFDSARGEVARFSFYNGWPSKISTDQLSVDSSDAVKETISLVIEKLERVK